MEWTQKTTETAKRNLAQRIARFLKSEAAAKMTAWQADQAVLAMTCLIQHRFPEGERAMMNAELGKTTEPAGYESGHAVTTVDLLERFDRAMKGE